MNKIKTIILKEWSEVFKNRMVLLPVFLLPMLFTALPLIMLYLTRDAGDGNFAGSLPEGYLKFCPAGLNPGQCFQVYIVYQFLLLFMMMPLIIPGNIAAYSIVGEKNNRTLEPILATPITTMELLTAKNLSAVIPALAATWLGFIIFAVGARLMISSTQVVLALLDPMWLIAVFIVSPLMAVLAVNFAIMVSSRVSDPRVAEQISALVILPLLLLFFGQISGLLIINTRLVIIFAAILAFVDTILFNIAADLFEREKILTRWS